MIGRKFWRCWIQIWIALIPNPSPQGEGSQKPCSLFIWERARVRWNFKIHRLIQQRRNAHIPINQKKSSLAWTLPFEGSLLEGFAYITWVSAAVWSDCAVRSFIGARNVCESSKVTRDAGDWNRDSAKRISHENRPLFSSASSIAITQYLSCKGNYYAWSFFVQMAVYYEVVKI